MLYVTKKNIAKLLYRGIVTAAYLYLVLFNSTLLSGILNLRILFFKFYHLIWLIIALRLVWVLLDLLKQYFSNPPTIPKKIILRFRDLLAEFTGNNNIKAFNSAVLSLFIIGLLLMVYLAFNLNPFWLYGFVLIAWFNETLCIILWCPFRAWFMANRCCNTCRIRYWGYWMVLLPLIVLPSFWNYSLFLLSILILVAWEHLHKEYPEKFYETTNNSLLCRNCKRAYGYCRVRKSSLLGV